MDFIIDYAGNHPLLFGGLILMFVVVFVYEMRVARLKGSDVAPAEAVALINQGAQPVDVRSSAQFEKGHILDARNIPQGELEQQQAALEKLQDRGILLYCDTGSSAPKAAQKLQSLGLKGVKTLRGGLNAWRAENLPVFAGRKQRKKKASS